MITLEKAERPYDPEYGDLVCLWDNKDANLYLETPTDPPENEVLPLAVLHPNPWDALVYLDIDAKQIMVNYLCPYTKYASWAVVPVALCSEDLHGKYKERIEKRFGRQDYWLDHEYHKEMWGDKRWQPSEIHRLMLGSGYTSGTRINDGSRSVDATRVWLSNGDYLWVYLNVWHNK